MSFASHLIHTSTVQTGTPAADPYNRDVQAWSDREVEIPCRLVISIHDVITSDLAQLLTVARYRLLLPAGVTVTENDRVNVTLEDGSASGPYRIKGILPRRNHALHHTTLELERVS